MNMYTEELDIDHGMEYSAMGDLDFYLETLEIYIEETTNDEKTMADCLNTGDIQNYTVLVHGLKSNSRTIGALKLGDFAEKMEMKGKEGDAAFLQENHAPLMAHLEKVRTDVRSFLKDNGR